MEREASVCDHGFERSDLCAEIIIIIITPNFGIILSPRRKGHRKIPNIKKVRRLGIIRFGIR